MDCKIWLKDRPDAIEVYGVENVRPIMTTDGDTNIAIYNDSNESKPIASFYRIDGYQLINRPQVNKNAS